MTLSPARRKFRKFLNVLLILSGIFFFGMVGLYASLKMHYIKLIDIAPTLMEVDAFQFRAKALFSDNDGKFQITQKLIANSFFSKIYAREGLELLDELVADDYYPAMTLKADLIIQYNPKSSHHAMMLYHQAANDGYLPAKIKLQEYQELASSN